MAKAWVDDTDYGYPGPTYAIKWHYDYAKDVYYIYGNAKGLAITKEMLENMTAMQLMHKIMAFFGAEQKWHPDAAGKGIVQLLNEAAGIAVVNYGVASPQTKLPSIFPSPKEGLNTYTDGDVKFVEDLHPAMMQACLQHGLKPTDKVKVHQISPGKQNLIPEPPAAFKAEPNPWLIDHPPGVIDGFHLVDIGEGMLTPGKFIDEFFPKPKPKPQQWVSQYLLDAHKNPSK